ncbi:hypothetical protein [Kordia sp.]
MIFIITIIKSYSEFLGKKKPENVEFSGFLSFHQIDVYALEN